MVDPAVKGLFDTANNNVYTDRFHYTISNNTGSTIQIYDLTNPPTSGFISITSGSAIYSIPCKSITISGTDINWTNPSATTPYTKTYIDGDTAVLSYDTGTTYWLPLDYTYQIKILKVALDDTLTEYASYPVATQVGTQNIDTSAYTQSYYYAALIANPITAPTVEYYLDTDLMYLNTGLVRVYGTVYDASTGATIGSQNVGIAQSGVWNNATSAANGTYDRNSFQAGIPISFAVLRAGYYPHTFSFTPLAGGSYLCDMYLTPAPAAPTDGSTTVFGYVLSTPFGNAIPGATVNLYNVTYLNTTTTTSGGYFEFTNLYNNTAYFINASATGFDNINSSTVTTGAVNSTTYKELWLTGGFNVTVQVRDSSTHVLISTSCEVILDTSSQITTSGSCTYSGVAYKTCSLSSACTGYNPETSSVVVTGDKTVTLYMDPLTSPTQSTNFNISDNSGGSGIGYPPHQVRFFILDNFGRPLQNVLVTATTVESTTPWSWLYAWMGINSSVNVQGTTLSGTTGLDGSWDTMMVENVRYNILVVNASQGINYQFTLYPQEITYRIFLNLFQKKNATYYPNATLWASDFNATWVSLNMSYYDPVGRSPTLEFWVMDASFNKLWNKTWSGMSAGYTNWSYQVQNTKGDMYYWGINATNTDFGNIRRASGVTMKGTGPLVDFGLEDNTWYLWFSLILMFLIGGIFSAKNIPLGAIFTPLWGGALFWYIGWLPIAAGTLISIAGAIGILVYMRMKEYQQRV